MEHGSLGAITTRLYYYIAACPQGHHSRINLKWLNNFRAKLKELKLAGSCLYHQEHAQLRWGPTVFYVSALFFCPICFRKENRLLSPYYTLYTEFEEFLHAISKKNKNMFRYL